jgi:hypothetical protein
VPNSSCVARGWRGGGDGGDGGASYARKTTRLTGGAGLPVRGSARERGWQVGLACQRERRRGARGRLRAREWAGYWAERRMRGREGGGGGGGHGMGQIWPSRGDKSFFFFLFIFNNSFPFLSLFFLNKSFSR